MAKFNLIAGLIAVALFIDNAPWLMGVNGVEPGDFVTDMTKAPFMAKFPPYDWPSPISCSGTIVSREHVILAAHCLNATMRNGIKAAGLGKFHKLDTILPGLKSQVFVGAPDIRSADAIAMDVEAFAFPPGFPFFATPFVAIDPHDWVKDYAVAKLAKPLKLSSKVQPINLVKHFPQIKANDNRVAYILGWGGDYPYQLRVGTSKLAEDSVCVNVTRPYYDYYRNTRNIGTPLSPAQLDEVQQNMTEALRQGMICTTPNPSGIQGGNGGGPVALKVKGKYYEVAVMENTFATNGLAYTTPFVNTKIDIECKFLAKLTKGAVKCKELPREHGSSSGSSGSGGSGGHSNSAGDADAADESED